MYKNHREAFQIKKGSKSPIESNLDNIINQAINVRLRITQSRR